jgi:hypothetical protein
MSDVLAVKPQNKVLAWGTAGAVGLLAIGGFILSFNALRDLAAASGILPELAWIWPLVVDGFIVVATAAAFGLKKRGPRTTWYPWSALALFAVVSVAGNAAHALSSPDVTVPVWVATVVSSVPAIALLIASHLLIVMIDGKPASRPAARRQPRAKQADQAAPPTGPGTPAREATETSRPAEPVLAQVEGPRLRAVEPPREDAQESPLVARLTAAVRDGEQVTGALIAELEGVSERTGRRRLTQLRETHPALFDETAFDREEVAR